MLIVQHLTQSKNRVEISTFHGKITLKFSTPYNGKTEQHTLTSALFCTNFIFTKMMNRLNYLATVQRTEKYHNQWFQHLLRS